MQKRLYKILEIIGILVILLFAIKIFPIVKSYLKYVFNLIAPFIISFFIAFIVEPIIEYFEKRHLSRKIAILFITVFLCLIMFTIARYFIPNIVKQLLSLAEQLPTYYNRLEKLILNVYEKMDSLPFDIQPIIDKIEEQMNLKINGMISLLPNVLQSSISYSIQIILIPVIAVYFMAEYKNIERLIKSFMERKKLKNTYIALCDIKVVLRQYIKGVVIVMSILSLVSMVLFKIIGVENSLLYGIIIGVTDIIPYFGPYIGGGLVISLILASSYKKAIYGLIIIVVLQTLENDFLVPKIQSKTMKTNALIVLISTIIMGKIAGIIGMIIAVPLVKIVEIIVKSYFSYLKCKK